MLQYADSYLLNILQIFCKKQLFFLQEFSFKLIPSKDNPIILECFRKCLDKRIENVTLNRIGDKLDLVRTVFDSVALHSFTMVDVVISHNMV